MIGVVYGFLKRPSKSYSLYGEDLIIKHLCDKLSIHNGYYLDIGCFHPKWISNTHLLAKNGWNGTVCDIDKWKLLPFSIFRQRTRTVLAGVVPAGSKMGYQELYAFKRFLSEWDTFSQAEALRIQKDWNTQFKITKIETIPIDILLTEVFKETKRINFLNIDVEGLDDLILSSIDFKQFPIDIIAFENNQYFQGEKEVQNALFIGGYQHFASVGGTHIYVLKSSLNKGYRV